MTESTVSIALLLPDVLGTYSDRGNAVVLAQRLRWRGIDARIVEVASDEVPPVGCDIYVLGGGEDTAYGYAAEWLGRHTELRATLQTAQVVGVCAGLQLLGRWVEATDGRRFPGAEILDLETSPGRRRSVGEVLAQCTDPDVGTLTGFENHRGETRLGEGLLPLGRVTAGTGNGDGGDGVLTGNIVATYFHGPVLARNPALADLVLRRATGAELPPLELPDQAAARRLHVAAAGRRRRALPMLG